MTNVLEQAAGLANVDKTPEQIAAEKAAKAREVRLAGWEAQARKLAAADPNQCCERINRAGSWHSCACSKKAKYHRQAALQTYPVDAAAPIVTRHYCATHDPILRKEREDAKRQAEKLQSERAAAICKHQRAEREAEERRTAVLSKLADGLTTKQLERLSITNPCALGSAVSDMLLDDAVAKDFPEVVKG